MPETLITTAAPAAPLRASIRPPRPPSRSRVVGENLTLLYEGGRNRALYRIVDGCVVLSQLLDDGRRQITDVLGPGRLFGFTIDGRSYKVIAQVERIVDELVNVIGSVRNAA